MKNRKIADDTGGKALPLATLALVVLSLLALGAGFGLLHVQTQEEARNTAAEQARRLAETLATELASQLQRDQTQLAGLPATAGRTLLGGRYQAGAWLGDVRLTRVPTGTDLSLLSFTERDLLRRLQQRGQDTLSVQGGDHPALLMAHATDTGSLILTRDLSPWLADVRRRLPENAGLTLSQGSLTLLHQGQLGNGVPQATARGGPITVTVAVTPAPVSVLALLPAAGLSALLLILAQSGIMAWVVRQRREPNPLPAKPASKSTRPSSSSSPAPSSAAPSSPSSATPPAPALASPEPPTPEAADAAPVGAKPAASGKTLPAALFGTDGIQGVAGSTLTTDTLTWLGRAIGTHAGQSGQTALFVARDALPQGPELMAALIDGLAATGRQVVDLGLQPAPVFRFATETLASRSGVYLSALETRPGKNTHPADTRLDIIMDGQPLRGEALGALRQRLAEGRLDQSPGDIRKRDIGERYLRTLCDDIVLARPMSLALDCSNGAIGQLAPKLFPELGCKTISLCAEPDETRASAGFDPTRPDHLQALIDTVRQQKLDLGLAFSGDGQRLALVSGSGEIIAPDRQLMLLARDLLQRNPGSDVLFDVKCDRALQTLIRQHGGRPVMHNAGQSPIHELMQEMEAPLAGEMNGRLYLADRWFGFADALYAGARVLEVLSQEQSDSATVFAGLCTGDNAR